MAGNREGLAAIARIAWESAQVKDRQLREIERLLVVGAESEAVSAMKNFFQMKPVGNGVTTHDQQVQGA